MSKPEPVAAGTAAAAPSNANAIASDANASAGAAAPVAGASIDVKGDVKQGGGGDPLAEHVWCFSTRHGPYLTSAVMQAGHDLIDVSDGVYIKRWAIVNVLKERFPQYNDVEVWPAHLIMEVENKARTGFWTVDPAHRFDEALFAQATDPKAAAAAAVKKKTDDGNGQRCPFLFHREKHPDTRFAVRTDFDAYLARRAEGTGVGTYLGFAIPVSWGAVTKGSVDEMFIYTGDLADPADATKRALSVAAAREWYTNPRSVYERRRAEFAGRDPLKYAKAVVAMAQASLDAYQKMAGRLTAKLEAAGDAETKRKIQADLDEHKRWIREETAERDRATKALNPLKAKCSGCQ